MTRGFPILLGLVLSIGMAALAFETDGFRMRDLVIDFVSANAFGYRLEE